MLISGTDKLGIFFLTISLSIGLSSKKQMSQLINLILCLSQKY